MAKRRSQKSQAEDAETPDIDVAEEAGATAEQDADTEAGANGVAAGAAGPGKAELDAALTGRLLRLQADFENFRKRTLREREDVYQRANADLMLDLLPVVDHIVLALESARAHDVDEGFTKGFELVGDQLMSALAKYGLKVIDATNEPFDPNLHEAISHLPSREVPADTVIEQTRRGYLLGSRLLRAAQVVVSSGAPEPVAEA